MKVLVTGGTGFIGRSLCVELFKEGHDLTIIARDPKRQEASWGFPSHFVKWDMENEACPIDLEEFEAIVHLAGESIASGLWTERQKKKILRSRIDSTIALGRALDMRKSPLPVFISASAIGIFPSSQDQAFVEDSPKGEGFLADVCKAWEASVEALPKVERKICLRFGLVLGDGGGYLHSLKLPTRLGLGSVVGDGRQWVSWIHRSDIIQIIKVALKDEAYSGPINVVAPETISQKNFQKTFSHLLHRPQFIRVPAVVLKAVLGEFSHLALDSQRVEGRRLKELGYVYLYPDLQSALKEALNIVEKNDAVHSCHRLEAAQFIDRPREEVFAFFCDPRNLEKITPPLLSFKIASMSTKEIAEGSVINYKLKVHSVPMKWKTLIKDWEPNEVFVDNQEKGPYSIWHHTHRFYEVKGGTLMTDRVLYRLPMGILGDSVALSLVKRDVEQIFGFRKDVIRKEFPKVLKSEELP